MLITGEREGDPDQRAGSGRGEPRDSRRALSSTTGLPPSPLEDARRAAEGFKPSPTTAEIAAQPGGLHAGARKAHIAQGYGGRSSHESSHGIPGWARRIRHGK